MFNFLKSIGLILLILTCSSFYNPEEKVSISVYQEGIYLVSLNTLLCKNCIKPYVSNGLETVKTIAEKTATPIALNAGFFDPHNKETISYINKNGKTLASPETNQNLMQNPNIQKYLPLILNRSEFRSMQCPSGEKYDITAHNKPLEENCTLNYSMQAGPQLLPNIQLENEAFTAYENGTLIKESASALHKTARTAVGIKDNLVTFVIVTNQNPMTLEELANLFQQLDFQKAMAFDGGSSTSLYLKYDKYDLNVVSAKENTARKIKSAILINP
ncbi:MAG: phosphodiester glycosidase family protein [bacterium]